MNSLAAFPPPPEADSTIPDVPSSVPPLRYGGYAVLARCCQLYHVDSARVLNHVDGKALRPVRASIMYILREDLRWTLPRIGRLLNRSHSVVYKNCQYVEARPWLKSQVNTARAVLIADGLLPAPWSAASAKHRPMPLEFRGTIRVRLWHEASHVVSRVAALAGVSVARLQANRENREPTLRSTRMVLAYLLRNRLYLSIPQIATLLNRSNFPVRRYLQIVADSPQLQQRAQELAVELIADGFLPDRLED